MERGGEQLDGGGGHELRGRDAGDVLPELGAEPVVDEGGDEGRDVEGGEDGHAVPDGEEGVAGHGDGGDGLAGRAEELDEDLVLVDAEADVGGARGGELGRARGDGAGGVVADGGEGRVERVGRQVRAPVQHEDEERGLGQDDGVGPAEEGLERGLERLGEGGRARGVFHDGSVKFCHGTLAHLVPVGKYWLREREREREACLPVDYGNQRRNEGSGSQRGEKVRPQAQAKVLRVPLHVRGCARGRRGDREPRLGDGVVAGHAGGGGRRGLDASLGSLGLGHYDESCCGELVVDGDMSGFSFSLNSLDFFDFSSMLKEEKIGEEKVKERKKDDCRRRKRACLSECSGGQRRAFMNFFSETEI